MGNESEMEIPENYRQRDAAIEAGRSVIDCAGKMDFVNYLLEIRDGKSAKSFKELAGEVGLVTGNEGDANVSLIMDIRYDRHGKKVDVMGVLAKGLSRDLKWNTE